MATAAGHEAAVVTGDRTEPPWRRGFFQALRRIEATNPRCPRLGTSRRLAEDPVRLGQSPSLSFAPATLASACAGDATRPHRLGVRFFGLWGPNGPLPLHLTEFARERLRRTPSDGALVRFADVFHHRMLSLLYRAWAESQPAVSADRSIPRIAGAPVPLPADGARHPRPASPAVDDPFAWRLSALAGSNASTLAGSGDLPVGMGQAMSGWLCGGVRTAEGAQRVLAAVIDAPVRVHEWRVHWLRVPADQRLRLRPPFDALDQAAPLGGGAVLGARVRDATTGIALDIGPLTIDDYRRWTPGASGHARLRAAVRLALGAASSCECRLILRAADVPACSLGGDRLTSAVRLGQASWLGRRAPRDADDLRWVLS